MLVLAEGRYASQFRMIVSHQLQTIPLSYETPNDIMANSWFEEVRLIVMKAVKGKSKDPNLTRRD